MEIGRLSFLNIQEQFGNIKSSEWPTVKKYFKRQISKAVNECKSQATNAKRLVGNIETRKWTLKKKQKKVNNTSNDEDEYISWGSDFDDEDDDDSDSFNDEEIENGSSKRGSYSLTSSSDHLPGPRFDSLLGSTYENTYEAISETPSSSSYGENSENSSSFYAAPSTEEEKRSDMSESNSTTSNTPSMMLEEIKSSSNGDSPNSLISEETKVDKNSKCKSSTSLTSLKPLTKPSNKPAIPPKPNVLLNEKAKSIEAIPKLRRKKIVRPESEPPPPPLPKSPPPLSPAPVTDELAKTWAKLTLDDLNDVLKGSKNVKQENTNETGQEAKQKIDNVNQSTDKQEINESLKSDKDSGDDYETPISSSQTSPTNDSSSSSSSFSSSRSPFNSPSSSLIHALSPLPLFDDNYCCSCRRLKKSLGSTPNLLNPLPELINSPSFESKLSHSQYLGSTLSLISSMDIQRPKLPRVKIDTSSKLNGVSLKLKLSERLKSIRSKSEKNGTHSNSKDFDHLKNRTYYSGSTYNLAQRPLPPLPDNCIPIEKFAWFHNIEREGAASLLKSIAKEGVYLVRQSKRAGECNPYSLSIYHQGKIFHLNIRKRSDGLFALGKDKEKEKTFKNVAELIAFHQWEPILLTTKGESAGITRLIMTPSKSS